MTPSRPMRFLAWLTLVSFFSSTVSAAVVDISSVPLVSMSTKVVRPNVMFILDDSGSMNDDFMPDDIEVNSDKNCFRNFGYNRIFFNPDTLYFTPKNADGTNMPDASFTATLTNGFNTGSSTIDLTSATLVTTATWSTAIALPNNPLGMVEDSSVVSVTTSAAHGLSTGDTIRISGLSTSGRGRTNNIVINDRSQVITVTGTNTFTFDVSSYTGREADNTGNYGGSNASYEVATLSTVSSSDYYYYRYTASPTSPPNTCEDNSSYTKVGFAAMTATEKQNFANWYSYYRTRLMMMKSAAGRAFNGVDDKFRVGFTTINETGTGAAKWLGNAKFDSTQKSAWYTKLYGISATSTTPLRGALSKAGRYYAGTLVTGNADPVQYSCQKNFAILTTDGYWNKGNESATYGPKREDNATDVGDQDSDITTSPRPMYEAGAYSNTLADIARYYWKTDLRTTTTQGGLRDDGTRTAVNANIKASDGVTDLPDGHQHMKTITLGLGLTGALNYPGDLAGLKAGTVDWPDPQVSATSFTIAERLDDLWHAGVNGGGNFFSATDPEDVVDALRSALTNIVDQERSGAAAATSSLEPVAGDNFAYIAQYTTARWTGDIEARTIDLTNGSISTTTAWSAQAQMEGTVNLSTDTRNIYTWNSAGNARVDFTLANVNAANFSSTGLSQYGGWSAVQQGKATADAMVKYLRGQHAYEMRNDGTHADVDNRLYRQRTHTDTLGVVHNDVMGDIIDSSPVFVKKPPFRYSDSGYASYVGAQAGRAGTVYVGANDGMLHAFDATTGAERWAYVPRMLHGELYKLADANYAQNHRYYVNGVITVGDAFDGTNWRTILIAGLGAGGKGYFALDVTDPTDPEVLWEITDTNLGNTFGNPILTKRNSNDSWVVLFASGYNNSAGDSKGRLFMVDAFSGASIGSIATGTTADPNLSGLSKITNWVLDTMVDNSTQYVYGGDLAGNLWRFDIDGMTVQKLGQTSGTAGARPITGRPEVSRIRDVAGTYHRVVYVGTGRYLGANDVSGGSTPESTNQLLLAVKDTGADLGTLTGVSASLVQQTVDTSVTPRTIPTPQPVNWVNKNGWYVSIPLGERVTIEPRLQLGTVSFVANNPVDDYCALGGSSWLYALDYKTGGAITTQADNVVGISVDTKTIGTGLTIVRLPNGLLIAIVNTPDGTRTIQLPIDAAGAGSVRRVGYREIN